MTSDVHSVASSFQEFIASGRPDALTDDDGEPAIVDVPLDERCFAQLFRNTSLDAWMIGVSMRLDHLPDERRETLFEALVSRTNQARFSTGEVASLDEEGRIALAMAVPSAVTAQDVASALERMRALCSHGVPSAGDAQQNELIGESWLRI